MLQKQISAQDFVRRDNLITQYFHTTPREVFEVCLDLTCNSMCSTSEYGNEKQESGREMSWAEMRGVEEE
ncbi:hypothetical protein TNCT_455911 [Trichonephila clavata]|uniref:Uncharacterized protein n=1 Tax=Trichonephila clavata TaxID=2740835 RepID=A0A8X6LVR8_TRICU|nr:hypothetical protein TNCT_455911 [Trichonephila clavata]